MSGFIERRDHRLNAALNRWRAPRWIRLGCSPATRLGDGWIWYSTAVLLFCLRSATARAISSAALAAVVVSSSQSAQAAPATVRAPAA